MRTPLIILIVFLTAGCSMVSDTSSSFPYKPGPFSIEFQKFDKPFIGTPVQFSVDITAKSSIDNVQIYVQLVNLEDNDELQGHEGIQLLDTLQPVTKNTYLLSENQNYRGGEKRTYIFSAQTEKEGYYSVGVQAVQEDMKAISVNGISFHVTAEDVVLNEYPHSEGDLIEKGEPLVGQLEEE